MWKSICVFYSFCVYLLFLFPKWNDMKNILKDSHAHIHSRGLTVSRYFLSLNTWEYQSIRLCECVCVFWEFFYKCGLFLCSRDSVYVTRWVRENASLFIYLKNMSGTITTTTAAAHLFGFCFYCFNIFGVLKNPLFSVSLGWCGESIMGGIMANKCWIATITKGFHQWHFFACHEITF